MSVSRLVSFPVVSRKRRIDIPDRKCLAVLDFPHVGEKEKYLFVTGHTSNHKQMPRIRNQRCFLTRMFNLPFETHIHCVVLLEFSPVELPFFILSL